MSSFPSDLASIYERIDAIEPKHYARSRNYLNGAVTRLSPYLTHGVLNTTDILEAILKKYSFKDSEKLIFELGWRDFFQTVYGFHKDAIFSDLRQPQEDVRHSHLPTAIRDAKTGIKVLDTAITKLYETGYLHNHERMWLAAVVCNVAKVHWKAGADWMYYHLLDGDLASNSLSWQWVAGSFSSKKYLANQDNLNKFSNSSQNTTFLDIPYSSFPIESVPEVLKSYEAYKPEAHLPEASFEALDANKPTLLYHMWMLDPNWHRDKNANRVLILEPDVLSRFAMSQKRCDFIVALTKNIPDLQIFIGSLDDFLALCSQKPLSRAHPAIHSWAHKAVQIETFKTMFSPPLKAYNSFMAYWKACQKTAKFKALQT